MRAPSQKALVRLIIVFFCPAFFTPAIIVPHFHISQFYVLLFQRSSRGLQFVQLNERSVATLYTLVLLSVYSFAESKVFVTTPPVNDTERRLAIDIVLNDGSRIDTGRTFQYRRNPAFSDIKPRNHLSA